MEENLCDYLWLKNKHDRNKDSPYSNAAQRGFVSFFDTNKLHNMIVRAKNHIEAETQVKVSVIANIHNDNF